VWTNTTYWIIVYVGIFPSLISLFFWQQGVALGGANTASLFIPLLSVFTVILSLVFLNQAPQEYQLIGMALVITGLAIAFYSSTRKTNKAL
ncbi:MAG: drug/metabolite transporter (DMT)-like permease, partial [Saprospiraceae bacterium]